MNKKKARKLILILILIIVIRALFFGFLSFFLKGSFTKFIEEKKVSLGLDQELQFQNFDKYDVKEQFKLPKKGEEYLELTVENYGKIKFKLFEDLVPRTVGLFKKSVKESKYDGVGIDKIIKDFGLQVGTLKEQLYGQQTTAPEFHPNLHFFNGALCVETLDGFQGEEEKEFYIIFSKNGKTADFKEIEKNTKNFYKKNGVKHANFVHFDKEAIKKYKEKGGTPEFYMRATVFGQIFSGQEIIEKISKAEINELASPEKPIIIKKAEIKKY